MGRDVDLQTTAAAKIESLPLRQADGHVKSRLKSILRQDLLQKTVRLLRFDHQAGTFGRKLHKQIGLILLNIEKQPTFERERPVLKAAAVIRADQDDRVPAPVA